MRVEGQLAPGVSAKDIILALIAKIGVGGGTGHVFEYTGSAIRALGMEERMTICNMSIEGGARAGMVAPDDTTFEYLAGREFAPQGAAWDAAVARWRQLPTDEGAAYDKTVTLDAAELEPMITYGTNPGMGMPITGRVPDPDPIERRRPESRARQRRCATWACSPASRCSATRWTWSSSAAAPTRAFPICGWRRACCAAGRWRRACACWSCLARRTSRSRPKPKVWPRSFKEAGAEWREAGCSMCIAMNGDQLEPGQYAVSTSNRNFEGPPGQGRAHLPGQPADGRRHGADGQNYGRAHTC